MMGGSVSSLPSWGISRRHRLGEAVECPVLLRVGFGDQHGRPQWLAVDYVMYGHTNAIAGGMTVEHGRRFKAFMLGLASHVETQNEALFMLGGVPRPPYDDIVC
jgi:hypothetical protein